MKRFAFSLVSIALIASTLTFAAPVPSAAADCDATGVTSTSIKIGSSFPSTGPVASAGDINNAAKAYFAFVNAEQNGVNGRKLEWVSYDDAYQPARTVENVRRLVEQDKVFATFLIFGSVTNDAVLAYLNRQGVPQVFPSSGATTWGEDIKAHPWTIGFQPTYRTEGHIYARYLLDNFANKKVGILYQNDPFGKSLGGDFTTGLKGSSDAVVAQQGYEITDTTMASPVAGMRDKAADVFMIFGTSKGTALGIKSAADLGWKPLVFIANASTSIGSALKPAGLDNSKGVMSSFWLKDPADPVTAKDPLVQTYVEKFKKYAPSQNPADYYSVYGWTHAEAFVKALRATKNMCRADLMRSLRSFHHVALTMLLPGITLSTSETDGFPVKQLRLGRFDGTRWQTFGPVLSDADTKI
jgi:branched-chain amino acid transport system substrate-binding protein